MDSYPANSDSSLITRVTVVGRVRKDIQLKLFLCSGHTLYVGTSDAGTECGRGVMYDVKLETCIGSVEYLC